MSEAVLQVQGVSKNIDHTPILKNISFEVKKGEVVGFLGRNGAGKTTTLRLLAGLTTPTQGAITINGIPAKSPHARKLVSIVVERPAFYESFSGWRNMRILLAGASKKYDKKEIERHFERVSLEGDAPKRKIRTYSKGMRTRFALAHAMSRKPEIYIFDEPASGLDPIGISMVRDLMRQLADEGGTVLFSSHLLSEIERICDRLVIIDQGQIVAQGTIDEIYKTTETTYAVKVKQAEMAEVAKLFGTHAHLDEQNGEVLVSGVAGTEISKKLFSDKIFPEYIKPINDDLELIFRQLIHLDGE